MSPTAQKSDALIPLADRIRTMRVTCEVVGGETHDLDLATDATYGDVLAAVDLSSHEASVLVDGSPVPEDAPVEADSVRVLRLIKGG